MPDTPIQAPQKEYAYMVRLQQERSRDRKVAMAQDAAAQSDNQQGAAQKTNLFPKGMFIWAICFDLIGFIPIVNIVTEPVAGFIFYRWQKKYAPNTNPLKSLLINKAIDLITVGISPSNSLVVLRAYSKNKTSNMI